MNTATEKQTEIALEKLVGHRFENIKELQKELKKISKSFTASFADMEELECYEDYKIDIADELGYGDIYYLRTRQDHLYITEVCYECDSEIEEE